MNLWLGAVRGNGYSLLLFYSEYSLFAGVTILVKTNRINLSDFFESVHHTCFQLVIDAGVMVYDSSKSVQSRSRMT